MTRARKRLELRGAIALVAVVAIPIGVFAASATGAPATNVRLTGLTPHVVPGATRVGAIDPAQSLSFAVVLRPSNSGELASLVHDQYDPASSRYGQWLAPGEYQRRFGPSPDRVAAVVDWLHTAGLTDTQVVDGRVDVHTTAGRAAAALDVSIARFRLGDGEERVSAEQAPRVPQAVAPDITAVVGLTSGAGSQPHHKLGADLGSAPQPFAASRATETCTHRIEREANALDGWSTRQTGVRYQVPNLHKVGLTGAGRTIAMYELAPHTASDVTAYLHCFGLHNPVTTRLVDGGAFSDPGGAVEANLDIEAAAVTAPGSKIVSYEGPNSELGSIHTWSAIVNDDTAQSISTSWGLCETLESASERTALHALFVQAAAQGQTIFSASGDSGSEGCLFQTESDRLSVDSPSNDPYVTAVGGTSLFFKAATAPYREPVWNDCQGALDGFCSFQGGAGGGGKSAIFKRPAFQPASKCANCRGVPDIAANAGVGEAFEVEGHWSLIGGTSIAAPRLAGIAADLATGCAGGRIGWFNPKVYALAKLGAYGSALRDVPAGQGDIDLTGTNGGKYPTANGFELATGLGPPLSPGLSCPEVARVRPATAAAPVA